MPGLLVWTVGLLMVGRKDFRFSNSYNWRFFCIWRKFVLKGKKRFYELDLFVPLMIKRHNAICNTLKNNSFIYVF